MVRGLTGLDLVIPHGLLANPSSLSTHKPLNLTIHSRILSEFNFQFEVRVLGNTLRTFSLI